MRTRVLFALTVAAALAIVTSAEATWPRMGGGYSSNTPMYTVPATATYVSGTVIGGPMYVTSPTFNTGTYTVVEQTGPLGIMRWRTLVPTTAPVMTPPTMTAT